MPSVYVLKQPTDGKRVRRRHIEAEFDEYFVGRAPALRRTAYLIVRDWHTAEDMVQLTFVKLYTAWPRIRVDSLEAYSRRVLVNACISHLRKHQRETVTDEVPVHGAQQQPEGRLDLTAALGRLPPAQRAVIALRFLEDLSVVEVARTMNIAEGTVKSHSARALITLRHHLADLAPTEE